MSAVATIKTVKETVTNIKKEISALTGVNSTLNTLIKYVALLEDSNKRYKDTVEDLKAKITKLEAQIVKQ